MKTKYYPYKKVRKVGERRKNADEVRVSSWDKVKPEVIFKNVNEKAWALKKEKKYKVIETKLISNTDDSISEREDMRRRMSKIITNNSHQMTWYFKIINEKGNIGYYPQTLFALSELNAEEKK